jgi:hypothetical protein
MPSPSNLVTVSPANIIGLLYETENSDNPNNLTQFSTPGSTGASSTYAFGPLQVDVGGNPQLAGQFLLNNGFTQTQVNELEGKTEVSQAELSTLNSELQAIPTAAMASFQESMVGGYVTQLNNVLQAITAVNPAVATAIESSTDDQLALVDYMNQYPGGISLNTTSSPNGMLSYLEGNEVTTTGAPNGLQLSSNNITPADIQSFVSTTLYSVNNSSAAANRADRLQTALSQNDSGTAVIPDGYDSSAIGNGIGSLDTTAEGLTGDITSSVDALGNFTLTGSNGTVSTALADSGYTLNVDASNSYFNFSNNGSATVQGSGNSLQCGQNDDLSIQGSNNFIFSSGGSIYDSTGDTGNTFDSSQTTINANANFAGTLEGTGNFFNLLDNSDSSLTIGGTDQTINSNGNFLLLGGASVTATLAGDNDSVTATGGILNLASGDSNINIVDGQNPGQGITVNMTTGDLSLSNEYGVNNVINMSGTGGVIDFAAGADINVAQDANVTIGGRSNDVNASSGDTLTLTGDYTQIDWGNYSAPADVTLNAQQDLNADAWLGAGSVMNAGTDFGGSFYGVDGATLNVPDQSYNAFNVQGSTTVNSNEDQINIGSLVNSTINGTNIINFDDAYEPAGTLTLTSSGDVVNFYSSSEAGNIINGSNETFNLSSASETLNGNDNDISSSIGQGVLSLSGQDNIVTISDATIDLAGGYSVTITGSNDKIVGGGDDNFDITGNNDDISATSSYIAFSGSNTGDQVSGGYDTGSNWSAPDPDDNPGSGGYGSYSSTAAVSALRATGSDISEISSQDASGRFRESQSGGYVKTPDNAPDPEALEMWLRVSKSDGATTATERTLTSSDGAQSLAVRSIDSSYADTSERPLTEVMPTASQSFSQMDQLLQAMNTFDSGDGGLGYLSPSAAELFSQREQLHMPSHVSVHAVG